MSMDTLVSRLSGVRMTGQHRGIALCPAHSDRSPSLSFREIDDGRVLIKCFGGCGAIDVLDSLGLTWPALFPDSGYQSAPPSQSKIRAGDLLKIVHEEALVVGIIAADLLSRRSISESDWKRLSVAVGRIGTVASYAAR
jgi:hypothetical protein